MDSIQSWINQSKNKNLDLSSKKYLLTKAYKFIIKNKLETPIHLSSIAYEFYNLNDSINFFSINKVAVETSLKLNNDYALGDSYWNFATYYAAKENNQKAYKYFNNAFKSFNKGNFKFEMARVLFGMAKIKGEYKDYNHSEILNIKSIKLLKELKNHKFLFTGYVHLARLQEDIKEYDKALNYYEKAKKHLKKLKKIPVKFNFIENNIANIYIEKEKYSIALKFYEKNLAKEITKIHLARVLDNRAFCKLQMKDTLNVKKDFFHALHIRDSLNNKTGILMSKIRISDYYSYMKDTINAIQYAKEANLLAEELKNGRDYLTSLKQLSNLDKKNSKKYLDRYIQYNDSLITVERKAQNKFTRIEFETDEHIEEKERLGQQLIWIIGGSISIILISTLLYFLRVQKVRNEKLQLEADQQKANEEVYVLTLQQQAKLEEERVKERNRISAELHDGILGKLFGTRVNLGFLGMQMNTDTQEKQQAYLDELQSIEKEIREVSHKLSDNFNDANINFTTIIKQLLSDKSVIGQFTTHFKSDDTIVWNDISEVTKANVYRIIQEALQNIIKHAKAKNVTLAFSNENEKLVIQITDDGVGFDTKKSRKGIGIKNINSRVAKLLGNVSFTSEPNKGTHLQIKIPIT
ncbi:tetratricopeptide repeat-containing sensor histidine kinase [Tenacibaculum jejuense]|uniref:histidine kinase n=1 Tax=Tenacibaculum jejuense TaxID=584609 RepID=A0A238UAT5_9FLAO|nr:sensor histidine kinase [Tenacibaculum jejuense]SNR16317.1 Two-component system sensor histidine kinase [Tenacibaculum jejuense]